MRRMTGEEGLALTGSFARGAHIVRALQISPIKASYLLRRRNERFVLRVDTPLARELQLSRATEFEMLRAAWREGFAPEPILLTDAGRGARGAIMVTRYAPGRAWSVSELHRPRKLVDLARLLRDLHERRLPGPPLDLHKSLSRYATVAGSTQARRLAARANTLVPAHDKRDWPLCHNDPVPGNVVGSRRPVLIDWEYAACFDPLFELAIVVEHHQLPQSLVGTFAASYFGGANAVPWADLDRFRRLYNHVYAVWLLALRARQPLLSEQSRRLAGLLRQLKSKAKR